MPFSPAALQTVQAPPREPALRGDADPTDLIRLRGETEWLEIAISLPRTFVPGKGGTEAAAVHRITVRGGSGGVARGRLIKSADILAIRFYEERLLDGARAAAGSEDWRGALEYLARLQARDARWAGLSEAWERIVAGLVAAELAAAPPRSAFVVEQTARLPLSVLQSAPVRGGVAAAHHREIQRALESNEFAEARRLLESLFRLSPQDPEALRVRDLLRRDAETWAEQARQALAGPAAGRARALELITEARRRDPALPRLDSLLTELRRSYPVLHLSSRAMPTACNLAGPLSTEQRLLCDLVYEPLTILQGDGRSTRPAACIAAWGELEWGLKHRVRLHSDLRFSDGTPVTAYEVASSLQHWRQSKDLAGGCAAYWGAVEVEDPLTLRLSLAHPHARPWELFRVPLFAHADKPAAAQSPASAEAGGALPPGTGPFRITEWTPQAIRLEANLAYHGVAAGRPRIQAIAWQQEADPTAVAAKLRSGEVQMALGWGAADARKMAQAAPGLRAERCGTPAVALVAFNHRRAPWQDLQARRAFIASVRRDTALAAYSGPAGAGQDPPRITHSLLAPDHPWYEGSSIPIEADRAAAIRELELAKGSATWPKAPLALLYPAERGEVARAVATLTADLTQAGWAIAASGVRESEWLERVATTHDYDLAYWVWDAPDPVAGLPALLHFDDKGAAGSGACMGITGPPALAASLSALRRELRPREARALAERVQVILREEAAFLPLWTTDQWMVARAELRRTPRGGDDLLPLFHGVDRWEVAP